MLLRRIRDHAKSHNWFGVGIDLGRDAPHHGEVDRIVLQLL